MHEMSLALEIVGLAVNTAERANGERINSVEIEVGTLAGVLIDSLEFCLDAAAKETMADGASFQLIPKYAFGRCRDCGIDFEVDSYFQHCPECDGISVDITGGKDLKVTAVTIEEKSNNVGLLWM